MFSLNAGAQSDRPEGNDNVDPAREAAPRKRRSAVSRWLRRFVGLGLGLLLLWAAAVFWLGLLYWGVPPVSTLMVGRWLTLQPVERRFISLDEISPQLPLAVMTSEDGRFCDHNGVDWDALRDVVEAADEDGPARGASTIPMQTAKNLFLWPGRSYLRKGLELPIALYLDLIWSKRKMMENYLNIVEWGEGVFGAEAAAQRYFGKPAKTLTRREAALLATALPNPLVRNPGRPRPGHRALAARLMGRMEGAAPFSDCLKG
ncbi:monofunctional biosynthetic peptidoglycan transglycosylase [Microvirga rosea]|uniref:monofunctional biosynthetic peptidoglycan transglycosylase n=1 Tax=Microvirga rosea TaxID=2715425 RepID=UPI001D0AB96B|nr:monofunctional biosynthetic peptidoglycan transglycosylase [Microvirga rosea]MCB8823115.1 monofunctional biosynthetic peptidoglycan transglycosylase [Microvirga rosea]